MYIYHSCGFMGELESKIFKHFRDREIKLDKELTLVSVMNKDCWTNSSLIQQCLNNSIELIIPKCTFNISSEKWKNTFKLEGIIEALNTINTKYVLILDGADTCILDNLDKDFLSKFKTRTVDILFNSQTICYPPSIF